MGLRPITNPLFEASTIAVLLNFCSGYASYHTDDFCFLGMAPTTAFPPSPPVGGNSKADVITQSLFANQ